MAEARGSRALRSPQRTRLVRRWLCRQHQGPKNRTSIIRRNASNSSSISIPQRRGRRRPAGRRRRRLPDPDPRRAAAPLVRGARPDLAAARPLRGGDVLPAGRGQGARLRGGAPRALHPRRGPDAPRLAREVPIDTAGLGKRVIETMPYIAQALVCASPDDRRPARVRAQDPDHQEADAEPGREPGRAARPARACATSTCRPSRRAPWSTRGCCWRRRSARSTRICATRSPCRRWPSCISASRPTPSHHGGWRTRTASSATTAKINTVRGNVNWILLRRQACRRR